MAERETVEVVIQAMTEAAEQAIDEVGDQFAEMAADAQPAQAAADEVADELDDVTSSGAVAQEAVEEVGNEAAQAAVANNRLADQVEKAGDKMSTTAAQAGVLSAATGRVSSAAGGASVSMGALNSMMTLSLIPSVLTLSTIMAPLAAVLGTVAAGALSLAGAFGVVVGVGAVTHMEELKEAFAEARREIEEIIEPLGEVFGPLLVDAVEALPDLLQNMVDAIGPLDQFAKELERLGGVAADVLPGIVAGMFELATVALPVFRDFVNFLVGRGGPALEEMRSVTERLAPQLSSLGSALLEMAPTLLEFGTNVAELVLPAVTDMIGLMDDAMQTVLNLDPAFRDLALAATITAPAIFSVAGSIGALLGPVGVAAAAVAAFAAAYRSNFMGIQDATNQVLGVVIERLQILAEKLQPVAQHAMDLASTITNDLASGVGDVNGPMGELTDNVEGLAGQYLGLGKSIASTIIPLFQRVSKVLANNRENFAQLGRNVTRIINGAVEVFRGYVSVVQFVFDNFISQVLRGAVRLFETHFGEIFSEVNSITSKLLEVASGFAAEFNRIWNKWGDEVMAVARFVGDVLSAGIVTNMDILLTTIQVILDLIQGDWKEAWNAVVGLFKRTSERIMTILNEWGITDLMRGIFDDLVQTTMDGWRAFKDLVKEGLATGVAIIDSARNRIFNIFAELWNSVSSATIGAFENIVNTVVDGLNKVIEKANDAIRAANKVSPKNFDTVSQIEQAELDTQAFTAERRTTDIGTLQERRREDLEVLLNFDVEGSDPLSRFVDESASATVQNAEDSNRRQMRRQNIGSGGTST